MHRKHWIWAGCLGALALLWIALDSRAERHASEQQLARLQADLETLRAGIQQRQGPGAGQGGAGRDGGLRNDSEVAELVRREARAEAQRALDQRGAGEAPPPPPRVTLGQSQTNALAAFEEESEDRGWSGDATRTLETTIRERLPTGSRLGSIDCRSTMCQVQVAHADASAAQTFLLNGFGNWPGSLFVAKEVQEAGEQIVTIIASREGHEPPLGPR